VSIAVNVGGSVSTICPVRCSECGMAFALDVRIYEERMKDGEAFYCPHGHKQHFLESLAHGETGDLTFFLGD
jgi:DNA-directed RNA polymerase subunit N (RpoN/RPB10)